MNESAELADALGGVVRVRIPVKSSVFSARAHERRVAHLFKEKGVVLPGGPMPKNAHDVMTCAQGRLEYHRVDGSEFEAVWTPA